MIFFSHKKCTFINLHLEIPAIVVVNWRKNAANNEKFQIDCDLCPSESWGLQKSQHERRRLQSVLLFCQMLFSWNDSDGKQIKNKRSKNFSSIEIALIFGQRWKLRWCWKHCCSDRLEFKFTVKSFQFGQTASNEGSNCTTPWKYLFTTYFLHFLSNTKPQLASFPFVWNCHLRRSIHTLHWRIPAMTLKKNRDFVHVRGRMRARNVHSCRWWTFQAKEKKKKRREQWPQHAAVWRQSCLCWFVVHSSREKCLAKFRFVRQPAAFAMCKIPCHWKECFVHASFRAMNFLVLPLNKRCFHQVTLNLHVSALSLFNSVWLVFDSAPSPLLHCLHESEPLFSGQDDCRKSRSLGNKATQRFKPQNKKILFQHFFCKKSAILNKNRYFGQD